MSARNHHYLSQCYLRGFTKTGDKRSKLRVYDFYRNKTFRTTPRNVGAIRDFNRITIPDTDPNLLETALGDLEGEVATALKELEIDGKFNGRVKELIINLIVLFAIRSPEMREKWGSHKRNLLDHMMDLVLESEDRWEITKNQMKENGNDIGDSITYKDIKKFHDSKNYKIEFPKEEDIIMEFDLIKSIYPILLARNWLLVKSNVSSGHFISSDRPVILFWKYPEKIPPFYRNSPGFGMKDTQVYFPISKNYSVIGEFEGNFGEIDGTREFVATMNQIVFLSCSKQLFVPGTNFYLNGKDMKPHDGPELLKETFPHINSNK